MMLQMTFWAMYNKIRGDKNLRINLQVNVQEKEFVIKLYFQPLAHLIKGSLVKPNKQLMKKKG